ncbi:MAG: TonB-dependent receptor [Pseudomonadota bacterium]
MGIVRRGIKRLGAPALLLAGPVYFLSTPTQLAAQSSSFAEVDFDIPAGRLSSAIRTLSRQARISVATSDRGIRQVRSRSVRGRMNAREALALLLEGTEYRAVSVGVDAYRIERNLPAPPTARAAPRPAAAAPLPPPPPPPQPIIVEATKRAATPFDYAGGIRLLDLQTPGLLAASASLDEMLASVPSVSGTALGSGRNKIFLRGIADSSFNGPTQATIGLYLGEQRIIFSAPNPDLRLVDMETVELLEGPQGSLYGAGTLAGLLRLNPRQPDSSVFEGEVWAAGATTSGGEESWDVGGVINAPIAENAAIRVVGYGGEEGGFIDDVGQRDLANINSAEFYGGRASFGWDVSPDWSVELNSFAQHTAQDDGQYVDARFSSLARSDRVAQPFSSRIYGGGATVRGYLGSAQLVSSTGLVDNSLDTTFDSSVLTGNPGRQAFRERREIRLLTHETRLSGGDPESFDWLIGVGAVRNRDEVSQLVTNLSGMDDPPPFARQRFRLDEIAMFGEGRYRFAPAFSATAGTRLLYTRSTGERSFGPDRVVEPRDGPIRLLPALALSWHPSDEAIVYIRLQQGYRTGGVTIERQPGGDPDTARFDPDTIRSFEIGLRGNTRGPVRLTYGATLHRSDWDDIQADILDAQGFPITRNIGDGKVTGLDASFGLETLDGWRLDLAAAYNDSNVDRLQPMGGGIAQTSIPNVPEFALNVRAAKEWVWGEDESAGMALTGRYTGRSFVDLDPQVRAPQGKFGSLDAAAWWNDGDIELRLEATNLTNTQGNRFAFGNPFTARTERQETPLRPRTVRAQLRFRF